MEVIVLGMHRTGTSLVANLLHNALGVHMGDRFLGSGKGNPWGVWEDVEFFDLNRQILCHAAGGKGNHWHSPPSRESILATEPKVRGGIKRLVRRRGTRTLWGWKDPRNCLTVELYHRHLQNPHYVITERSGAAVVASLERRALRKRGAGYWKALIRRYEGDRDWFLAETGAPHIRLQFEALVARGRYYREVGRLADFLGLPVRRTAIKKIVHCRD